jgi:hypothetical protein
MIAIESVEKLGFWSMVATQVNYVPSHECFFYNQYGRESSNRPSRNGHGGMADC